MATANRIFRLRTVTDRPQRISLRLGLRRRFSHEKSGSRYAIIFETGSRKRMLCTGGVVAHSLRTVYFL